MGCIAARIWIRPSGLIPAEESNLNTAVFITHLHLDHMSAIGMVAPQVPIYMYENAISIERALETTGDGVQTLERSYRTFTDKVPITVGAIEVSAAPHQSQELL